MRNFILNHRKLFLILLAILFSTIITTIAISSFNRYKNEKIENISTCSQPSGEVVCKGIDVSSYQMEIDFNKVKSAGYDFVILRAGTGLGKDKSFELNYKLATEAGLDVGCYFYTYATTVEEVKKDAKTVLKYIKSKTFNYPVFLDFEEPALLNYKRIGVNTKMINAFCKAIKRAGHYPGVYMSRYTNRDFVNTAKLNNNWDVWIADYSDYSGIDNNNYRYKFSMWQYSDQGNVDGIETNVDMNLCFVDYPSIIADFREKYDKIT